MNNSMMKLFVYGTLLKGLSNHHLIEKRHMMGECTLHGALMYNIGSFPGIILSNLPSLEGNIVKGELYTGFSDEEIHRLDAFEGYRNTNLKQSLYVRVPRNVVMDAKSYWRGSETIDAFVYVFNQTVDAKELIPHGDYRRFLRERAEARDAEQMIVAPV